MSRDTRSSLFEDLDDERDGRQFPISGVNAVFLAAFLVLVSAGLYEYLFTVPGLVPFWGFSLEPVELLFYLSLVLLLRVAAVPVALDGDRRRYLWRRLRRRPLALLSTGYLALFVLVGTFGPWAVETFNIGYVTSRYGPAIGQPPPGFTIPMSNRYVQVCTGHVVDGVCHGSWQYPFGTTARGSDLVDVTVQGARIALQVAVIASALAGPIATAVGTLSAYYGGRVDEVLMRYVDIQQVIPMIFVVIITQQVFGRSLFLIVLVFGLLNWGGMAHLVRSEALQRVDSQYVRAAELTGASDWRIIRRHLVPNVSGTIAVNVTLQMPTLVVVEAAIAFLGFAAPNTYSWGATISQGFEYLPTMWWIAVIPAVFLALTAASLHVLGDALREVLDPRLAGRE